MGRPDSARRRGDSCEDVDEIGGDEREGDGATRFIPCRDAPEGEVEETEDEGRAEGRVMKHIGTGQERNGRAVGARKPRRS